MFLIFLIFASLVTVAYFKVRQSRASGPIEKRWHSSKGSIAIGVFFIAFGINSYVSLQTTVSAITTLIFVVFGAINLFFGYKHFRMYTARAKEEQAKS
jgi:drug/metabolite transporter (DMT)-like permease